MPPALPKTRITPALLAALTALAAAPGCSDRECRDLKEAMLARYDPFADRCGSGADCRSGSCDGGGRGVCRCESDSQCGSGLCLTGLCANPDHDRRLTPALADVGSPVRTVCDAFLAAERALNTDPACNAVYALLEDDACHVCDEAALRLCACRTGAAMHECLVQLAFDRAVADGPPDDGPSEALCTDQVENTLCDAHRGPPGSPCGGAGAGPVECRSGLCRDVDRENNGTDAGDDPRDWVCIDACAADSDCLAGWRCDHEDPVPDAPVGRPFACHPPAGR